MMQILGRALKAVLVTLFYAFLFAVIGSFLISPLIWEGIFTTWKKLPVPPEPAERIVHADIHSVEIQSASGIVYVFIKERNTGGKPNGYWIQIDEASPYECCYGKFSADLALPYFGTVKEKVSFHFQGAEESINGQYVVTTEGNVVWWRGTWSWDCILFGFIYGGILGVIIGILVSIRNERKRSASKHIGIAA